MENLYNKTKFILKKYNISANKSLGQNFLINDSVVDKIVESAEITKEDLVIEIGPGLGNLTEFLLEKAGKVIAIELDERMLEILNDRFSLYDNFEIINEDVLKVDLNKLIKTNKNEQIKNAKIVAMIWGLSTYAMFSTVQWLKENFCIDSKASEFFFDKDLTVEAKARCIANASMLRCCIKLYYHGIYWQPLMGDKFDWISLADAVKELRADYDHNLPVSPSRLREKMNLFERNGYACLVSGKYGNQNAKKL